jgi:pimeloyl-ACP methyl ester carboxylesterase
MTAMQRPVLTLPPQEAQAVCDAYATAGVILEYGSGGSTVVAAELAGKTIFSVESDAKWLAGMTAWFDQNPPLSPVHLHHGNIGATKAWGHPKDASAFRSWPGYPLSVWDLPGFVHPDLVLIDGRFRAACFLTCLFRSTKPMTVLWDDYIDRPFYHRVEDLLKPVEMIGRMARFEMSPMPLPIDRLAWVIETYLRPN